MGIHGSATTKKLKIVESFIHGGGRGNWKNSYIF